MNTRTANTVRRLVLTGLVAVLLLAGGVAAWQTQAAPVVLTPGQAAAIEGGYLLLGGGQHSTYLPVVQK